MLNHFENGYILEQSFAKGGTAAKEGKLKTDNPYTLSNQGAKKQAWNKGWEQEKNKKLSNFENGRQKALMEIQNGDFLSPPSGATRQGQWLEVRSNDPKRANKSYRFFSSENAARTFLKKVRTHDTTAYMWDSVNQRELK